ncbi:MAG: hypothetical protein FWD61_03995 [Phycisphaerales bacterium]|nr:hypothetical protein [Phycisphaerales bacterium]
MAGFIRSMRLVLAAVLCLAGLAACDMLSPREQEALYQFPEGKRVLVLVDVRPTVGVPPEFATQLGQSISDKLMQWRAADAIVPQNRVLELKANPAKFSQMGIANIAQAADADVVLHVDLVGFNAAALSDESITEGGAQALVKVVDRQGNRLWPPSTMGTMVEARVAPAFSEQRSRAGVQKEITDRLATRTARMFIKFRLDDPAIAK